MSRPCDAFDCSTQVATGRFMCIKHWRMVPLTTQRTINARYRAIESPFDRMRDLAYVHACASAVQHIVRLEGRCETENSYSRLAAILSRRAEGAA